MAMKPHERRAYPYYRLAVWQPHLMCYKDNAKTIASIDEAGASARRWGPGKYRISEIREDGTVHIARTMEVK